MFLLALIATAVARVVLVLPAGEDASAWIAPATLAGFTIGNHSGGSTVELLDQADGWIVRVTNAAGDEKVAVIAPPLSAQTREDAIWLATSLLRSLPSAPLGVPIAAMPPALPEEPPDPRPREAPRPEPEPRQDPLVLMAVPAPPAPVVPEPPAPTVMIVELPPPEPLVLATPPASVPVEEPVPRRAPGGWAALGPAVTWRRDLALGAGADLVVGLRVGEAGWVALGGRWTAPRTIPEVEGSVVNATADLYVGGWWSPPGRLAPVAGMLGGASFREYGQGSKLVGQFVVPVLGADAGAALRLSERLDLLLVGRAVADTVATLASLGEAEAVALSPWEAQVRLALRGTIP